MYGLNVKLLIDDNDVTIAGHPSQYMKGYSVENTLKGHGLNVNVCNGEDLDSLYQAIREGLTTDGPFATVVKRPMTPGVAGLEGTSHGHDSIPVKLALQYFDKLGNQEAVKQIKAVKPTADPHKRYLGSGEKKANRKEFGAAISNLLDEMSAEERKERVMVIDADLLGSTGLAVIKDRHPEVFKLGGIMERGNISAAAGFGMRENAQGIFSTFAAFLEMCVSEITMARLNHANLLCHFSHSGSDDMADNTCHFGINNFFADNGLEEHDTTRLYFPADAGQLHACVREIFHHKGLRFLFSTRSSLPQILDHSGKPIFGEGYRFVSGKDDIVREGTDGWVVSYGDALYRSLDAVERLRQNGLNVGLVNKATLNVVDEAVLARIGDARVSE